VSISFKQVHVCTDAIPVKIAARFLGNHVLRAPSTSEHDAATLLSTWRKPEVGRLKLNFDGSSKHASRRGSIGGVYRDHKGGFVLGYAERIGNATSSVAELAALRRGLELALENGWLNISIEGDAKTVVDVVRNRASVRVEEDLRQCEEIAALLPLLDDGDMAVSHVRRAGNRVAHGFAKLGHSVGRPRVWRGVPPDEVLRYLQRDAEGK
jgi:ribonuclease HI